MGSIAFAIMALLAESLKEHFSFPWITMMRSGVATILAAALTLMHGAQLVVLRPSTLWMRSLAGWASMICGFYAMTHYDVSIVLSITNMFPIWVALLSWPMLRKMPTFGTWCALGISVVGTWLVYNGATAPVTRAEYGSYVPEVAIPMALLAGMFSGVALIGLHQVRDVDERAIVAHFSGVATLLSFLTWLALPIHESMREVDSASIWRLVGIGVAATVGQLFLTRAFACGSPARVSVVGLSQVVFAAVAKWFMEGQVPTVQCLFGMLLVLCATVSVMLGDATAETGAKLEQ